MVQRLGRPTARGLLACVLALGLAFSATACSTLEKAKSAAIVNGVPISTTDVAETTKQYNEFVATDQSGTPKYTEARTVGTLVLAGFIIQHVEAKGSWKPDVAYNNLLSTVPGATPTTIELLKFVSITGGNALAQTDVDAILATMAKAKVEVDPRYGVFDPTQGGFKDRDLNWIKPVPAGQSPTPASGSGP
ncbi:MAG: hypothetical protein ABI083_11015 [Lapillicoccus sp.]